MEWISTQRGAPNYLDTIKWNEETVPMAIMLVVIGVDKDGAPESILVGKRSKDKQHYPNKLAVPTEAFKPLEPGYYYNMYDVIKENFQRTLEEELLGFDVQKSPPLETIRLNGILDDKTGFRLFIVSLQVGSEELKDDITNTIPTEWIREFSDPPILLNLQHINNKELTDSSLSAIKMVLEQRHSEKEVFDKFPGLKDLSIYGDDYLLMFLITNYLQLENSENIEELKKALAFRIIDGIQYEPHVDMFLYPPWADNYKIDLEEIDKTFFKNQHYMEIEEIAKTVHIKIWKSAFIEYFDQILEATVFENRIILIDKKRPYLPEIPKVKNSKMVTNFLDKNFGYFQNAYILLHVLTGSVPKYIDKYIAEGKADYVLQNTINSLAGLLADGNIAYWYQALDIACSGIIESKSSLDILYTAIDVFNTLTKTQFTNVEFSQLESIASEFVEKKIKEAFV